MTLADSVRRLELALVEVRAAMLALSPQELPEYGKLEAAELLLTNVRDRLEFYVAADAERKQDAA